MFEKEAEEYALENYENCLYDDFPYVNDSRAREQSFKDGARFGYNKANEWHYVKDELPEKTGRYLILNRFGERYFTTNITEYLEGAKLFSRFSMNDVYAWKEIVLSELPKETK